MTENPFPIRRRYNDDDVQGHGIVENSNETVGVDVQGHGFSSNSTETDDVDDDGGHVGRSKIPDAQAADGADVEGHLARF